VIGDGPEARRLQRIAGPTVTFTGRVSDKRVAELLRTARALVVTATEEFGIAAVESLASGRPVIALESGGVLESVQAGATGVYYAYSTPEALAATVETFDPDDIDPQACRAAAERFGTLRFQAALRGIVAEAVAAERAPRPGERRGAGLFGPRAVA
jgi:glycosyltransferase involved in cell wall biosynthesis